MKTRLNTRLTRFAVGLFVLLTLVTSSVAPALAQTKRRVRRPVRRVVTKPAVTKPEVVYYNVNAGQVLRVRMNQTISSETARMGDQFSTTVVDPVYAGGVEVIPAGSIVTGRVATVDRAGRKSKAGSIGVHFIAVRLPTGITRTINGDLTDLSGEMNSDNEGEVSGRSATKRNVVFIGGGAATGAVIGAIAGGGKGAGIGALIGGGLGTAGALFSKGHEAVVKSGTEFGVVLNQPLSLPAANVR
jgi:hypothetical protein